MHVCCAADADDLSIHITPSKPQPQANQPFSLTCSVIKATGLSGTPTIEWYDAMGNLLSPAGSNLPSKNNIVKLFTLTHYTINII